MPDVSVKSRVPRMQLVEGSAVLVFDNAAINPLGQEYEFYGRLGKRIVI